MKKKTFSTELAWLLGLIILTFGVTFSTKADFGVSMVVAPAYILYLKLSPMFSFVTFGMMEYALQAVLLLLMVIVLRQWKITYLFSFLTAVLYGFILDGVRLLLAGLPEDTLWIRGIWYVCGIFTSSLAIALLFKAYLMPEVYELLVKVVSEKFGKNISVVKTVYDCTSCAVSVILSFSFFGFLVFRGVSWGTVVCALVNGVIIGAITKFLDKHFVFRDTFPWRNFFEGKTALKEAK